MNVRDYADKLGTHYVILRAISYDPKLKPLWDIPVRFNSNLRNSAGQAFRDRIELHRGLGRATLQEHRTTFLHEVAHVCEFLLYDKCGHGRTWWEAMIRLGEKPWESRFHNIEPCKRKSLPTLDDYFPKPSL